METLHVTWTIVLLASGKQATHFNERTSHSNWLAIIQPEASTSTSEQSVKSAHAQPLRELGECDSNGFCNRCVSSRAGNFPMTDLLPVPDGTKIEGHLWITKLELQHPVVTGVNDDWAVRSKGLHDIALPQLMRLIDSSEPVPVARVFCVDHKSVSQLDLPIFPGFEISQQTSESCRCPYLCINVSVEAVPWDDPVYGCQNNVLSSADGPQLTAAAGSGDHHPDGPTQ